MNTASKDILIVDDNEMHRYTVSKLLQSAGYQTFEANCGQTALEVAKRRPKLIILDVNLPDINGLAVCRELKSSPDTASIPILHLSASRVLTRDRTLGLETGADAYMVEPVDDAELLATVKALLRVKESEERANRLVEEWKITFDSISEGICVVAADGTISRCNSCLAEMLEEPYETLVGKPLRQVIEEKIRLPFEWIKRNEQEEVQLGHRWCRVKVNPLKFENSDEAPEYVVTFTDITQLKAAEFERKRFISELGRSNEELNQFAFIASHDLKEPLRTVNIYTSLLQRQLGPHLNIEGREAVKYISQAIERMYALIDDLLEFSKVGQTSLMTVQDTELNQVVATVCRNLGERIGETNAKIEVGNLPRVAVDPLRYGQLFQNLISNAIKFKGSDKPEIKIDAEDKGGEWHFSVRDNGIGIKQEYFDKIFVLFQRLHSQDEYSGTGIGLATSKKIVQQHGGKIWVNSNPGEGSAFYFSLPK